MKKESILLIVGAVLVLAALAACLIFIFVGPSEQPQAKKQELNFEGTWIVVANYVDDAPIFVENQYMIFTDKEVSMYKDSHGEAFAHSAYTISNAKTLVLSDISMDYIIAQKTDNCIRLYDTTDTYMLLVRNSTEERVNEPISGTFLEGKWNVALKAEVLNNGESLSFAGQSLEYYKDSSDSPFATADYVIENNILTADALALKMRCYKISDTAVMLVEESGIVWELSK